MLPEDEKSASRIQISKKKLLEKLLDSNKEEKSDASKSCCVILTGDNSRDVVSFGTEAGLFQEIGISTVVCGPGIY